MTPPKMKLYEFSLLLSVHTVIAAESEEAAWEEIKSYSEAFFVTENGNADVIDISDVELFDVRDPRPHDPDRDESLSDWLDDEAHVIVEPKEETQ